jgi:hypothetical protein
MQKAPSANLHRPIIAKPKPKEQENLKRKRKTHPVAAATALRVQIQGTLEPAGSRPAWGWPSWAEGDYGRDYEQR